jgi:uncharacterized protein
MKRLSPASIHKAIPELVSQLSKLGAKRVILYGSRARGDNLNPRADIDLAVDAPDIDAVAWADMRDAVENSKTLLEFDLVRLQDAPERLHNKIMRDGRILGE